MLEWVGEELARPRLATLITTCTWLIFDKLQLTGSQVRGRELEWSLYYVPGVAPRRVLVSCSAWHLIPDYQRLEEFARNLPVTNDLAERVGGLDFP